MYMYDIVVTCSPSLNCQNCDNSASACSTCKATYYMDAAGACICTYYIIDVNL